MVNNLLETWNSNDFMFEISHKNGRFSVGGIRLNLFWEEVI
jgi:hypothetical protein